MNDLNASKLKFMMAVKSTDNDWIVDSYSTTQYDINYYIMIPSISNVGFLISCTDYKEVPYIHSLYCIIKKDNIIYRFKDDDYSTDVFVDTNIYLNLKSRIDKLYYSAIKGLNSIYNWNIYMSKDRSKYIKCVMNIVYGLPNEKFSIDVSLQVDQISALFDLRLLKYNLSTYVNTREQYRRDISQELNLLKKYAKLDILNSLVTNMKNSEIESVFPGFTD